MHLEVSPTFSFHMSCHITIYHNKILHTSQAYIKTRNTKEGESDFFQWIHFSCCVEPSNWIFKTSQSNPGYQLSTKEKGVKNVVTTPFADNFNILTRDKIKQQNLISDIKINLESMGLSLKPQTCWSLSKVKGKVENIKFVLSRDKSREITLIDSVINKLMKFLGSVVGAVNSPSAMFVEILSKIFFLNMKTLTEAPWEVSSSWTSIQDMHYLQCDTSCQCTKCTKVTWINWTQ